MSHPFMWDRLWVGGHLATLDPELEGYGEIRNGALASRGGRIVWVGPEKDLPSPPKDCAREVHDLQGGWLTPGLMDCHTHLVFGGDRSGEFEARLGGASYEEIARAGGGIRTTLKATREAGEDELFQSAVPRLLCLHAEGVTTLEIKSGYGQEPESELRMLRVARRLGESPSMDVRGTLLAAHVLPEEYEGRREDFLEMVREEMIPRAVTEGLADAIDAFCEDIAFSAEECREVLEVGRRAGLGVHLHADQLTDGGGASLAAGLGALSADHLEHASRDGVQAMAKAGTVAVLLPGAFFFIRETHPPPVPAFREAGVPMAVATDLNPGSSPLNSILLAMSMACTLFGLTPEEAFRGVTVNAARALGLEGDRGSLEEGKKADLALWEIGHPRELSYWLGANPCRGAVKNGHPTASSPPTSPHRWR
ncbi:MAG: imidazolonepropionase [Gemmatimonadota bacterium]|jgi:imidazolonepropionase